MRNERELFRFFVWYSGVHAAWVTGFLVPFMFSPRPHAPLSFWDKWVKWQLCFTKSHFFYFMYIFFRIYLRNWKFCCNFAAVLKFASNALCFGISNLVNSIWLQGIVTRISKHVLQRYAHMWRWTCVSAAGLHCCCYRVWVSTGDRICEAARCSSAFFVRTFVAYGVGGRFFSTFFVFSLSPMLPLLGEHKWSMEK